MLKNFESKMGFITYSERDYWLGRILPVFGNTSPLLLAGVMTVLVRSSQEGNLDVSTLFLIVGLWVAVSVALVAVLWFTFRVAERKRAEKVRKEHEDYISRVTG